MRNRSVSGFLIIFNFGGLYVLRRLRANDIRYCTWRKTTVVHPPPALCTHRVEANYMNAVMHSFSRNNQFLYYFWW